MKKTYNSPSMKVVKIALHQMVAESTIKLGGSYNGSTKIESREDNSWDIWGNEDYDDEY